MKVECCVLSEAAVRIVFIMRSFYFLKAPSRGGTTCFLRDRHFSL